MVLPNFLVIGAGKSGTTSLCAALGAHPSVFMCDPKEPSYFTHGAGEGSLGPYEELFAEAGGYRARGEGSTTSTMQWMYPEASQRIADLLPEARLIYIVRHPMRRIESHYMDFRTSEVRRPEVGEFNRTVERWPHLLDMSMYWRQIERYRRFFPDDRIHILTLEHLQANRTASLESCFRFLGLDPDCEIVGADAPLNQSMGRQMDRTLWLAARKLPGAESIRAAIPSSARRRVQRLLKRPLDERPAWRPDVEEKVLRQLRPDTERFLAYAGIDPSLWSLDATPKD